MIQDIWFCFWGPDFGAATAFIAFYAGAGAATVYAFRRLNG